MKIKKIKNILIFIIIISLFSVNSYYPKALDYFEEPIILKHGQLKSSYGRYKSANAEMYENEVSYIFSLDNNQNGMIASLGTYDTGECQEYEASWVTHAVHPSHTCCTCTDCKCKGPKCKCRGGKCTRRLTETVTSTFNVTHTTDYDFDLGGVFYTGSGAVKHAANNNFYEKGATAVLNRSNTIGEGQKMNTINDSNHWYLISRFADDQYDGKFKGMAACAIWNDRDALSEAYGISLILGSTHCYIGGQGATLGKGYYDYCTEMNQDYTVGVSWTYTCSYTPTSKVCNHMYYTCPDGTKNTCTGTMTITQAPSALERLFSNTVTVHSARKMTQTNIDRYSSTDSHIIYPVKDDAPINITQKHTVGDDEVIATSKMDPITVWASGRVYGATDTNKSMERGVNTHENGDLMTLNLSGAEGGMVLWSQAKMKMSNGWHDSYKDLYVTNPCRIPKALLCTVAVNVGDKDPDEPYKNTLNLESNWDGWASTMEGLEKTGILAANGDDRNCVVHGGSTVYIGDSYYSDLAADKLYVSFTGYIPCYFWKTQWNDDRDIWSCCDCDGANTQKNQNYPFGLAEATQAAKQLREDIEANLSHSRLELMVAEGIYRQGEEDLFDNNSVCITGTDRESYDITTFGTIDGTAGRGRGNKLDLKNAKYQLDATFKTADETHSDTIGVKDVTIGSGLYYYSMWCDPRQNNQATLHLCNSTGSIKRTAFSNTTNLNPRSLRNANGDKDDFYTVHEKVQRLLDPKWKQMNQQTGWVTNTICALDYNVGDGPLRTVGYETKHGQTTGWYNEGFTDIAMVEFQFEYELSLGLDAKRKWVTIDPALCGENENRYDLRNWTDNDSDGVEDNLGDLQKPGAMNKKIRTARFQLSTFCDWNTANSGTPPSFNYINMNEAWKEAADWTYLKANNMDKNTDYVASLFVVDTMTAYSIWEGETFDPDDNYDEGLHYQNLPIYCKLDNVMKSKFFYIDNCTVEDSSKP